MPPFCSSILPTLKFVLGCRENPVSDNRLIGRLQRKQLHYAHSKPCRTASNAKQNSQRQMHSIIHRQHLNSETADTAFNVVHSSRCIPQFCSTSPTSCAFAQFPATQTSPHRLGLVLPDLLHSIHFRTVRCAAPSLHLTHYCPPTPS